MIDYIKSPQCVHYDGGRETHCKAGVAYEAVRWTLLGYSDDVPCLDIDLLGYPKQQIVIDRETKIGGAS